jgi:hypothetical protein
VSAELTASTTRIMVPGAPRRTLCTDSGISSTRAKVESYLKSGPRGAAAAAVLAAAVVAVAVLEDEGPALNCSTGNVESDRVGAVVAAAVVAVAPLKAEGPALNRSVGNMESGRIGSLVAATVLEDEVLALNRSVRNLASAEADTPPAKLIAPKATTVSANDVEDALAMLDAEDGAAAFTILALDVAALDDSVAVSFVGPQAKMASHSAAEGPGALTAAADGAGACACGGRAAEAATGVLVRTRAPGLVRITTRRGWSDDISRHSSPLEYVDLNQLDLWD